MHLELERFFNIKRYKINNLDILFSIISLLIQEFSIKDKIQFILSKHRSAKLYQELINRIYTDYGCSNIYEVEHLDCHAAFCYLSNLEDALVVAMDGGGDYRIDLNEANFRIYHYKNNIIIPLKMAYEPRFDGRIWSIVSQKLFNDRFSAGKTMGIAAYGKFSTKYQEILLNENFFQLGDIWRPKKRNLLLSYLDVKNFHEAACLAYTLQNLFTHNLIQTLSKYRSYSDNLVLSGGCALNVITNSAIGTELTYKNVYVPPCPGDEGQSLGALLYYFASQGRNINVSNISYLGQGFEYNKILECDYNKLVSLIIDHKIVAWHMGRSETGPRALGHRSILALPTQMKMKVRVSETIKKREFFRPVAPIILEEYVSEWFELKFPSPYMSFAAKAKDITRELAPAIVHVDGTSRIQTLTREINPELYELILRVYELTGIPMLINTSLNIAGLPICNFEHHSKQLFVTTTIDALNLNGNIYVK
ncbi:MAG: carbamoyltransferase C-terminal domain-containing protein [Nostoc sp.]